MLFINSGLYLECGKIRCWSECYSKILPARVCKVKVRGNCLIIKYFPSELRYVFIKQNTLRKHQKTVLKIFALNSGALLLQTSRTSFINIEVILH